MVDVVDDGLESVDFEIPTGPSSIIKAIGVGGGGGNAINHMYHEGVHEVTFVVCNTDNQALMDSPVPTKIQLGKEGLGAGNRPEKARLAAEDSLDDIRKMLNDGTRMAFITAGMGGGTGTGAAPIIAREAKAMDILTVGIVTIPFLFEGKKKINQALDGVDEISKNVDALLVINNERLREIYPDLNFIDAFGKADDTLSVAARSIAEIITEHGIINLDFNDVRTVLKDGGVAIMSTGYGEGESRVNNAIKDALNSPLLNNNDIFNSKKVLLSITFSSEKEGEPLKMEEMNEVHDFMRSFSDEVEVKWGVFSNSGLGKKVKITILATGFGLESVPLMKNREEDANEQRKKQEEIEKNDERFTHYYKDNNGVRTKPSHNIYKFGIDDLDNDDIISMVDAAPTYNRSRDTLGSIRSKGSEAFVNEPQSSESVTTNKIQF